MTTDTAYPHEGNFRSSASGSYPPGFAYTCSVSPRRNATSTR
jgi:hypothetical protein